MWSENPRYNRTSFRTSSFVVLYVNLIMNFYEVMFFSPQYQDLMKKKYLEKELAFHDPTYSLNGIIFPLIEILVFVCAIISLSKKKSCMLTFTIVILLLDILSTVLSSVSSFYRYLKKCDIGKNSTACEMSGLWTLKPDNTMKEVEGVLVREFTSTGVLILLTFACLLSVAFKSYCIVILQGYKLQLKISRTQCRIDIRDSSDVDRELPCYSYVVRSDVPPRYVSNPTITLSSASES